MMPCSRHLAAAWTIWSGRRALVHLGEHLVRAGLGAAEDHAEAGRLERAPGFVGKARQRVDPRLAPPAQPERCERRRRSRGRGASLRKKLLS